MLKVYPGMLSGRDQSVGEEARVKPPVLKPVPFAGASNRDSAGDTFVRRDSVTASTVPVYPNRDEVHFGHATPLFGAARTKKKDDDEITVRFKIRKGDWERWKAAASNLDMTPAEYALFYMPHLKAPRPKKKILDGAEVKVIGMDNGQKRVTKVRPLLGPEQIFNEWLAQIEKAQKYVQVAMYDFDNITVEGGRTVDGADVTPGWKQQQQILPLLIEKARKGIPVQIILDSSVEYKYDEYRIPEIPRPINNAGMVEYLRDLKEKENLPIEVVTYPRRLANIYHVKMLAVDGERAIVGGMNLSNHSAANWDACVAIEGPEVANIQKDTFYPDWIISKHYADKSVPLEEIRKSLPEIQPLSDPAIQVLNTKPREYAQIGYSGEESIGDFVKAKLKSDDLRKFTSEQFIWTHKELRNDLIKAHQEGRVKVRMLHSSGVVDQFPYSRNPIYEIIKAGVPVRFYNENESTQEKLHAKWTVFNDDEVLIGSANMSAAGLETNVDTGKRPDYESVDEPQVYKRGNRDMAIVIKSPALAKVFQHQFDYDWKYSPLTHPPGYGQFEKAKNHSIYRTLEERVKEALKAAKGGSKE